MAAAYIRRVIGIDQPEFSDDINEPLFRDTKGVRRPLPAHDVRARVKLALRNNGVVVAAFVSALCLGEAGFLAFAPPVLADSPSREGGEGRWR